jgi:ribonucleotide monophosphatase NagD (HAD superfamily)
MDSLDFSLMAKLLSVQKQIQRIFVTDRDRAYPGQYGERLPGTAWVIAAIEELLEMEAVLGGKPNPEAFALAAEIMGMPVKDVVVIGDSVDTDIMPARASGAQAILLDGPLCRARGSAALQKEGLEVCEDLADAVSVVFD